MDAPHPLALKYSQGREGSSHCAVPEGWQPPRSPCPQHPGGVPSSSPAEFAVPGPGPPWQAAVAGWST